MYMYCMNLPMPAYCTEENSVKHDMWTATLWPVWLIPWNILKQFAHIDTCQLQTFLVKNVPLYIYVFMYVCMYVCIYVCVRIYIYIYIYIYIRSLVRSYEVLYMRYFRKISFSSTCIYLKSIWVVHGRRSPAVYLLHSITSPLLIN